MNITDFLVHSMEWIRDSGWLGVVWFIFLYAFTSVLFLPGSFLTVGAGAIYGFWFSVPLVAASSTLGSTISFLITRYVIRGLVEKWMGKNTRFLSLEHTIKDGGWKILLISRISPIVPHTLISYAAGLTNISFWRFSFASFIGFIPISAAYSYVGAMLGSAVRTTSGLTPHDPVTWTFYIVGLVATIVVIIWVGRFATTAWKQSQARNKQP